jgi:uncharacterized protein with HEPN domain
LDLTYREGSKLPLQSAELAVSYTAQCSKAKFEANIQLQDSVIRRLLVIAEAARRVSEATRQTLPKIAWAKINVYLSTVWGWV